MITASSLDHFIRAIPYGLQPRTAVEDDAVVMAIGAFIMLNRKDGVLFRSYPYPMSSDKERRLSIAVNFPGRRPVKPMAFTSHGYFVRRESEILTVDETEAVMDQIARNPQAQKLRTYWVYALHALQAKLDPSSLPGRS